MSHPLPAVCASPFWISFLPTFGAGPLCLMTVASKHCAIAPDTHRCLRQAHRVAKKLYMYDTSARVRTEPVPAAGFMRGFPAMLTAFQSLRTNELASSCICGTRT